ncbi:MAG: hypothetical protein F6K16_09900 [Symploca sp. SIO2B6]|nr:hypothetical protein [Symploca sp. SIO2B6]
MSRLFALIPQPLLPKLEKGSKNQIFPLALLGRGGCKGVRVKLAQLISTQPHPEDVTIVCPHPPTPSPKTGEGE